MTYIHDIVSKGVLVYFKYLHKNILKIKIINKAVIILFII